MATVPNPTAEKSAGQLKQHFAQLARAGLPFNPTDQPIEIKGANIDRIKQDMLLHGWTDLRFVTEAQAKAHGWKIKPKAPRVEITIRDPETGQYKPVLLLNAQSVSGIPDDLGFAADVQLIDQRMQARPAMVDTGITAGLIEISPAQILRVDVDHHGQNLRPQAAWSDEAAGRRPVPEPALAMTTESQDARPIRKQDDPAAGMERRDDLMPGYSRLVSHGHQRYLGDPNNNPSYFVELEDAAGARNTLWGLGLEASLRAAGAKTGDAVAITEQGRKNVTVQVMQGARRVNQSGQRIEWLITLQPPLAHAVEPGSMPDLVADAVEKPTDQEPQVQFAVMAPYWLNGLHNHTGLTLAKELNKVIAERQLRHNREAAEKLLGTHTQANALGLTVVEAQRLLQDPWHRSNPGEPQLLLNGALIRDDNRTYRPRAGGATVLEDGGDTLILRRSSDDACKAAMELAAAKGWKAINLKGSKTVVADAWLEARLMGLEVANYTPSDHDRARYAQRLSAIETAERPPAELEVTPSTSTRSHPIVRTGEHLGPIVHAADGLIAQKTGRDASKVVWHETTSLLGLAPAVGETAHITYLHGKGTVTLPSREPQRAVQR